MATREELIKSLKACANGNCTECAYNQGEIGDDICEKANGVIGCGCYDRMMADAAKMLALDCLPETPRERASDDDILIFFENERAIRSTINRNLNKEYYPGTKPSIDFIKRVLDYAQKAGIKYDVSDMSDAVLTFAKNSTNHSDYCTKLVSQMKFKSEIDDCEEPLCKEPGVHHTCADCQYNTDCPLCPPVTPYITPCEERRICKQDGHFYAEISPLADRINYICSFITDSSMKYKKPVRLSLVDELHELVKYYDRFAISEEDNRNWGSYSDHTF